MIALVLVCGGESRAADPAAPIQGAAWALDKQKRITLDACMQVWSTDNEIDLNQLETDLANEANTNEVRVKAKITANRLKITDAKRDYNTKLEAWTKATQKVVEGLATTEGPVDFGNAADKAKKLAAVPGADNQAESASKAMKEAEKVVRRLETETADLNALLARLPAIRLAIADCIKDQRTHLQTTTSSPPVVPSPPIADSKDIRGIWRVACDDVTAGKELKYAGSFLVTIQPGNSIGNRVVGKLMGDLGELPLDGFLSATSNLTAQTPDNDASGEAKNKLVLTGTLTGRDLETPDLSGSILGKVQCGICTGDFSR